MKTFFLFNNLVEHIYEANKKSGKIEVNDIQSDKSMDNSLGGSSPNATMRRDSETNNSQSPTNNTLNQELNIGDAVEPTPENTIWINKMLKVFALEWAKSGYFKVNCSFCNSSQMRSRKKL